MHATVMMDGQIAPRDQALVSVFDRGFLYGDSVFESLRTYHGVPFALDTHLARLERSAARVFIPLPVALDTLRQEVLQAVAVHAGAEAYVRLMLTRGIARAPGLDPELAESPLRLVLVTELQALPPELYEHGISAITYRAERPSDAAAVTDAKIGNYLLAVLATRAAREAGAREALIEDHAGNILEGATSNVFAVVRGSLVTAPETSAVLPGITRALTLEVAADARLPVDLRPFSKLELAQADEVFITSSLRELVPVVSIDGHAVGAGKPGPVTRTLLRGYRARVGA